jgi:hypothetical protein
VPAAGAALVQYQQGVVDGLLVETANIFAIPLQQQLGADQQAASSANLAFWGVVGLAFTVILSAAFIDASQMRGGYRRGPRGVPRPVYSWDYPPR